MASTGEVACFGRDRDEALLSAMIATGFKIPKKGGLIALEVEQHRVEFIKQAEMLLQCGLNLYATPTTAEVFKQHNLSCNAINISQLIKPNQDKLIDFMKSDLIDMVISVPGIGRSSILDEGYYLRRLSVDLELSLVTDISLAMSAIMALTKYQLKDINICTWKDYLLTRRHAESELA